MDGSLGIYIHLPFCRSKCPYCDFYSLPDLSSEDEYIRALCREMKTLSALKSFADGKCREKTTDSVYLGGGTPSAIKPESAEKILRCVRESFKLSAGAEISAECNPSSERLAEFLERLSREGLNRVSLGLQSAVSAERRALGRRNEADCVISAVNAAKKAGIENISLDIMLGIPAQSESSLKYSLDFALGLGVTHISAYMLKIEKGTQFYKRRESLSLPDEDSVADMYLFMSDYLKARGMRHYEISNFCFNGFESRHNLRYWLGGEYLGFGAAAHSFYNSERFYFERDTDGFIRGMGAKYDSPGGDAQEYIMLRLRLDGGIAFNELRQKFGIVPDSRFYGFAGKLCEQSLAVLTPASFSLSPRGFLLSNSIINEATDLLIKQRT